MSRGTSTAQARGVRARLTWIQVLAMPLGFLVTMAVGLAAVALLHVSDAVAMDAHVNAEAQSTRGPAQALASRHGCWSGPAPADMQGVLPGHVVVAVGAHAPRYSAKRVGAALDHVFKGTHPELTVYAFCR